MAISRFAHQEDPAALESLLLSSDAPPVQRGSLGQTLRRFARPLRLLPLALILLIGALFYSQVLPYNVAQAKAALQALRGLQQPSEMSQFLADRNVSTAETLFVVVGDSSYSRAMSNLHHVLSGRQDGTSHKLLVLCLNLPCLSSMAAYGARTPHEDGLLVFDGYATQPSVKRETVAGIKFASILDLIHGGHNFVYLDADVYINPFAEPLGGMLPINPAATWDMQFQVDEIINDEPTLNIGWMWIRPTAGSQKFWQKCQGIWKATDAWDQGIVLDEMRRIQHGESDIKLDINLLSREKFVNWMVTPWWESMGNNTAMQAFVRDKQILHFTCVETPLKELMAKLWGYWADMDGYYSAPPKLIELPTLSGNRTELRAYMGAAVQIARASGRRIILPEWVNQTGVGLVPGLYVFFVSPDLQELFVEPNYLFHRAARGLPDLSTQILSPSLLDQVIQEAKAGQAAAVLSFSHFALQPPDVETFLGQKISPLLCHRPVTPQQLEGQGLRRHCFGVCGWGAIE